MTSRPAPSATVTETGMPDAPDGFMFGEPDVSGSPATIVSDGTADVTVTNHLTEIPPETGSLKVTKVIPESRRASTGSFDVHVDCGEGGSIRSPTIDYPDPGFVTIDGLPAGAVCAVHRDEPERPARRLPVGRGAASPAPATIVADQTADDHRHQPRSPSAAARHSSPRPRQEQ